MASDTRIVIDNLYKDARKRAAKWQDALSSQAGAAEKLNIDESTLGRIERGTVKVMNLDLLLQMAELYNAPELLNNYCANECPLCRKETIADSAGTVDEAIVKVLYSMKQEKCAEITSKLLDIGEDNMIDDSEVDELMEVCNYLDKISKAASELKILAERAIRSKGRRT